MNVCVCVCVPPTGMVVGLNYENPYLNPYKEFQRWKHHPEVSTVQHTYTHTYIQFRQPRLT
jgi:flavin-dependent dehydrogenase